jgi:hypothetical protein
MSKPPSESPRFVTCRCQHCDGNIEFDACDFDKGETRNAECPHCHLETVLFIPQSKPPLLTKTIPRKPVIKNPKTTLEIISMLCMFAFFAWTILNCVIGLYVFGSVLLNRNENPLYSNNQYAQAGGAIGFLIALIFGFVIWLIGAVPTFLIWFMTRKK